LKHHERKLLKKTNFLQWKSENNHRELEVIRRYHVQDREEYKELNKICGMVTKLTNMLRQIDPRDPDRVEMTEKLLDKLYSMGAIPSTKSLTLCDKLYVVVFEKTIIGCHGSLKNERNLTRSGDVYRTRTRQSWPKRGERTEFPRHEDHGRFRHVGRHFENSTQSHGVQR